MHVIKARSVGEALAKGVRDIYLFGLERGSRNGRVLEFPTPVTTVYINPQNRVLFDPSRDANPFFHLFESLWILQGRNDIPFLGQFVPRMASFSDDGKTLHGAYGYRIRQTPGIPVAASYNGPDQLSTAITMLKNSPDSRRVVLQIWDAFLDLNAPSLDIPCNDMVMFKIRQNQLHMTVNNRSNDMIWGAYGANAVHFSILHEYVARSVGVPMGLYYQVSDSLHAYLEDKPGEVFNRTRRDFDLNSDLYTPTNGPVVHPAPLFEKPEERELFDLDLEDFFEKWDLYSYKNYPYVEAPFWNSIEFRTPFFNNLVMPAYWAWYQHKHANITEPLPINGPNNDAWRNTDWAVAMNDWLKRHSKNTNN